MFLNVFITKRPLSAENGLNFILDIPLSAPYPEKIIRIKRLKNMVYSFCIFSFSVCKYKDCFFKTKCNS